MSEPQPFVAEILRACAAGYAAAAAEKLLARHQEVAARFGEEALASWKAHLAQRLQELAAALEAGEPDLFVREVTWARRAFAARQVPATDLRLSLVCLQETLHDMLPEGARDAAVVALQRAIAPFDTLLAAEEGDLDPEDPHGRLALSYLLAVLEGDKRRGVELVLEAVDGGMPIPEVYLKVLMPAQREVGRMWHENRLDVDEEHFVTATTRDLMSRLVQRARPAQPVGRVVVAAAVAGNVHDIGLQAVAHFFEMAGWRTVTLGADVPAVEIARAASRHDADLVVLSAAMATHLPHIEETVRAVRRSGPAGAAIIVGGRAFERAPDLGRRLGADGQADTPQQAVALGERLAAGKRPGNHE